MNKVIEVTSHSEDETIQLAQKLANSFLPGDLIVLKGTLGAGKTVFVRGLAIGLGHDGDMINSPSYTIVNEYPGEKPLYHFDLYRIQDPSELYEIGWDEYLNRNALIVVEWGEKADKYLPEKYYLIEFELLNEKERSITISLVHS